ncbi:fungal-specific transcription factor domain-containing protein [Aspergillus pseudotamarii]|uniref:Fungal-specific transcription factor domain-containing protein n=1 Tax=Aspergillus pseudotamarii TaxID=132259 RepID=A0A5N6SJC9_ASPPS|nr:fungal-specific transcription factor domain-containing protein [Aspergillus pseudotamarii]KAE8134009.1 fungal-specific transcription factor domain-containing protein [Aspergillus pseudotamarii]
MEKEGTIKEYEDRIRALVEKPSLGNDDGFSLSMFGEQPNLFAAPGSAPMIPFDMSVQTNTQAFINNVPLSQGLPFPAYNHFSSMPNPQLLQPTTQLPPITSPQLPLPMSQLQLPVNQLQASNMQVQVSTDQAQPATTQLHVSAEQLQSPNTQFQSSADQLQPATTQFQTPTGQAQSAVARFQASAEQFQSSIPQLQTPTDNRQPAATQFQVPVEQSATEYQLPAEPIPSTATQFQAHTEHFQSSTPQLHLPDGQFQSSTAEFQSPVDQAQSSVTQFQVPEEQFQSSTPQLQSPIEQFQSSTSQAHPSAEQYQTSAVHPQPTTNHIHSGNTQFQPSVEQFQSTAQTQPSVGQFQSPAEQFQIPSTPFQPSAQFQSPNPQFQPTAAQFQAPGSQFQPLSAQFPVPGFQFPMPNMQLQTPTPNPNMPTNNWFQNNTNYVQSYNPCGPYPTYNHMSAPGPMYQNVPLSSSLRSLISVEDRDRPLLDHFVDNVLRLIFPVIGVHQGGASCINEILKLMQSNRSYLHCCLSAGAIHLKTSMGMEDQMDHDIMQHRYAAISQLSRVLSRGSGHMQILDATLAMILYHCSVGTTDDYLPDVPWTTHFQAVTSIIKKLNCAPNQFNISLITWIDILGATMQGTTPEFSHTHRTKHLSGTQSGLQQLMGCDDRVMYLISEIVCLEALKIETNMDELTIYSHVSAMTAQIDYTEPTDRTLEPPFDANGAVRQDMLTKIITTLYRIAARIYLFSLTPGFDFHEPSVVSQVARVAEILQYMPSGPRGYDRCLVWPLFIVGVHSVPSSIFRKTLAERVAALGYMSEFGSFGRMYRVLKEIWKESKPKLKGKANAKGKGKAKSKERPATDSDDSDASDESDLESDEETPAPASSSKAAGKRPDKPGEGKLHWREIMRRNKWNYLLL